MGLDMSLNATRYLSDIFVDGDAARVDAITKLFPDLISAENVPKFSVNQVRIEAIYWRKANAIHNWFVRNCQDGNDDCRPHRVTRMQLNELKDLCQFIIENPNRAEELLPTKSGFFFGSVDIDEWYTKELERTIKGINIALNLPATWEFEYRSSW